MTREGDVKGREHLLDRKSYDDGEGEGQKKSNRRPSRSSTTTGLGGGLDMGVVG
jgi:hypothetical protein